MNLRFWIFFFLSFINFKEAFKMNNSRKASSILCMRKDKSKFVTNHYLPKTINQEKYVKYLNDDETKILIVCGPAGTGKTMFACLKAIHLLKIGTINRIIITRPIIPVEDEEIGYLPGNIVKKMDPWTKPIFDLFLEIYSKTELDNMIYSNIIEICPLAFMRGRTFKNAFIIADEMQNSSPSQMKMLTTRLGNDAKMVITGDLQQTDLQEKKENGLKDFLFRIKNYESNNNSTNSKCIQFIEFDRTDIERSEVVKKVIDIYDHDPKKKPDTIIENKPINQPTNKVVVSRSNNDAALIPYKDYYKI